MNRPANPAQTASVWLSGPFLNYAEEYPGGLLIAPMADTDEDGLPDYLRAGGISGRIGWVRNDLLPLFFESEFLGEQAVLD